MPDLQTPMHLRMLRRSRRDRSLPRRLLRAVARELRSRGVYGLEWGDPDAVEPLKFVRDRYLLPYVNPAHRAVEIGPGGGRWTRYMLGFQRLFAVDYHAELLDELKRSFDAPNLVFIRNDGSNFPGIEPASIDFVFSFGTFVHLDKPIIAAYLKSMRPLLRPGANVVLQYADKRKVMAQLNEGFSENTPQEMRRLLFGSGYTILEEDLTTLWHSSIVRFTI